MRALWSAAVSRSLKTSSAGLSSSLEKLSLRHASRTRLARRRGRPAAAARARAQNGPWWWSGLSLPKKARTEGGFAPVRPQRRLGAAAQQADRRPGRICGDEGHVAVEARCSSVSSLRRIAHSTSLRATGSLIVFCRSVGLRRLAPARGGDRFLQGGDVGRGGRRRWRRAARAGRRAGAGAALCCGRYPAVAPAFAARAARAVASARHCRRRDRPASASGEAARAAQAGEQSCRRLHAQGVVPRRPRL